MTEDQARDRQRAADGGARRLRLDLHLHTLASDGIHEVETMIGAAVAQGLDAIAVTDHERIDAAVAGQAMARHRGRPVEVIVGEEITTRGGHLLGLYLRQRIRPWRSLKDSVARVHEQGGLAVVAHPLVPYPLCASEGAIRRLMDEADPIYHPDALEGFNPSTARMRWSRRVPALAEELGLAAVSGSDAHRAENVGAAVTVVREAGTVEQSLRRALAERDTSWEGEAYAWAGQMGTFARQTRKNLVALKDEVGGRLRRDGTGRDLGYPGGRTRPVAFDRAAAGLPPEDAS
jgi:predicted metal-dependent phosphoesterase TrpH